MKAIKLIEIKDFKLDTRFKIGDKILMLTGFCRQEQIEICHLQILGPRKPHPILMTKRVRG
jgi:hypothetical protein